MCVLGKPFPTTTTEKTTKKTNQAALGIFFETSFGLSGWCTSMEMFLAVNFSMSPVVAPQKTQTNLERFRGRDVEDRHQRPAPSMLRKRLQCFKNIMTHDSCHYCLLDFKKLFKKSHILPSFQLMYLKKLLDNTSA